jgi:pSer/pThr/pTyr-binding forkhead associated (FHA) protein
VAVTDQMIVGREPACELCIDVDDVSRRHATVVAAAGGWAVKDLGSRNGTFVNDQQVVTIAAIFHMDHVRFGASADYVLYDPAHPRLAASGAALPATTTITPSGATQSALTSAGAGKSIPMRHAWPKPPDAEGYVLSIRGPIAVERDGKLGKAALAVGLGLINPVLAFIPFAVGKNQILVTTMRLDDLDKGRHVAVTIVGDARTIVEEGDLIAIWGRVDQGTVFASHIYNYTTDAMSQVVK